MRRQVFPSLIVVLLGLGCESPAIKGTGAGGGAGSSINPGRAGSGGAGGSGFALPDAAPAPSTDAPVAIRPDSGPCQRLTCTPAGGKYCGKIGDGCGGTMECGADCPMGLTCGGGGVKNLCGAPRDPNCKPIPCEQQGGRLCGRVGDGCGGSLECGDCPGGAACGGTIPNVCGSASGPSAICDNLCKQQVMCAPGQETAVTGTVFAPTPPRLGVADPLYNALVYVPNRPLAPFTAGVTCDLCGTPVSGSPLVTALTGPDGKFTLKNVPAGDNIPLVIQIGRWRREVTIPKVTACTSVALPAELTRLPRNQKEGNIPQMAIATGIYDPFECVLRKIGIEDSEFTPPTAAGRVHVYRYMGARLMQPVPSAGQLVGNLPANMGALGKYDMVLLPCDDDSMKLNGELRALHEYTAKGGRLFLTDFSYSWLKDGPAGGLFEGRASWLPDTDNTGYDYTGIVDQSFPKGQAFAEWLRVVGASTMLGQLPIHDPYNGAAYFDGVVPPTQRWLHTEAPIKTVQHFTFNTPVGAAADKQCGRVVYSTFHVAEEDADPLAIFDRVFPRDCTNHPMTPQEKALEFMLFDASACVQPDTERPRVFEPPPPAPPPPPPVVD